MEETDPQKNSALENPPKPESKSSVFFDFFKFILITAVIVIPIRLWIAQPFLVSGRSMAPTFQNGDYLIIDEITYDFQKPRKNDVIVFRFPRNPAYFFIKRIAGLPNETVEINDQKITLGDKEYFVLGDNSGESSDSRVWGPVPEKNIIGRVLTRLWPLSQLELFPGRKQAKN